MSIVVSDIRLPLTHFALEANTVFSGRFTALFGASGAGKTSLLEIIAGLRRPTAGKVVLDGTVLTDAGSHTFLAPEKRRVGYVPQEGALFPHLTAEENLTFGFDPGRSAHPGLSFNHVIEVLEIEALISRRVHTLSGGERQRVALGRALLSAPRLLLLDEPLAGLDEPLRDRLLPYFIRVRDEFKIPILYVTHSPEEVVALCDEVVVLTNGKIEQTGRPSDIFVPATAPRYVRR